MKHIMLIMVQSLFFSIASAQTPTAYDTCSAIQTFQGTWMYQDGQDTIRIHLRYHEFISYGTDRGINEDRIFDDLVGWIEYKQGNVILESNYSNRYMTLPYSFVNAFSSFSILLSAPLDSCGTNKLSGLIKDSNHHEQLKSVECTITNNGTQMLWKQQHLEFYGATNGDYGMTLPREFVLIKQ